MKKGNNSKNDSGLNFEAQLWAAADKMRGHIDACEYKHVVLGLIFLKYISDAFEEKREQLLFGIEKLIANNLGFRTSAARRNAMLPNQLPGELRVPAAEMMNCRYERTNA